MGAQRRAEGASLQRPLYQRHIYHMSTAAIQISGRSQYPGDPQHSLVEQTSQICEVTCSEASRPDCRPCQPYFESWVKRGDQGYSC